MTPIKMPPVPDHLRNDPVLFRWLQDLVRLFGAEGGVAPQNISLSGKTLSDLGSRDHDQLTNIKQADAKLDDAALGKHVTNAQMKAIEDAIKSSEDTSQALRSSLNLLMTRVGTLEARNASQDTIIANNKSRLDKGGL